MINSRSPENYLTLKNLARLNEQGFGQDFWTPYSDIPSSPIALGTNTITRSLSRLGHAVYLDYLTLGEKPTYSFSGVMDFGFGTSHHAIRLSFWDSEMSKIYPQALPLTSVTNEWGLPIRNSAEILAAKVFATLLAVTLPEIRDYGYPATTGELVTAWRKSATDLNDIFPKGT